MTRTGQTGTKCVIGVDFGNSVTKLSIYTEKDSSQPVPVVIPGVSRIILRGNDRVTSVIPSVIHYAGDGSVLIGMQVIEAGLLKLPETVRWMAHYISLGSPVRFRIKGKVLSYQQAASDFLCSIVRKTSELYQTNGAEMVVAVPTGTRDRYISWLSTLNLDNVVFRLHVIEQPAAVVSACLREHDADTTFMTIDAGGTALTVSIVTSFLEDGEIGYRTVGRARGDFGGEKLDRMLLQFAAGRSGLPELDHEQARARLFECESAKERLSFETAAVIQWQGGQQIEVSRKDFEGLLAMEGVYDIFSSTIEQALKSAAGQGYSDHALSSVILIGGLGDIPSFRTIAESRFGPARLIVHHPVDCIARGAATGNIRSFPADRVRYRYAIRIWNPETAMFELRTIIRKGCPIPSNGPVNRFRIQASYDGQSRLGIPLYRLAPGGSGEEQHRELRYDLTGGIFIDDEGLPSSGHDSSVWINEKNLPLIPADPPAMRGEPRFEILFSIDASRELLISARDIRTGKQVLQNFRAGAIR